MSQPPNSSIQARMMLYVKQDIYFTTKRMNTASPTMSDFQYIHTMYSPIRWNTGCGQLYR